MKLAGFRIYRFHLKLSKTLKLKNSFINCRDGLLIKLTDKNGNIGWGEISPLPLFSKETIEEALEQLLDLKSECLIKENPNDIPVVTKGLYPSVSFGVETALLNLMGNSKGLTFSSLININSSKEITVNALLSGDSIMERVSKLKYEGYTAFKLKIGRQPVDHELALIQKIRNIIGEDSILRLDANRAFEYDEAVEFINQAGKYKVEYIEEPFRNGPDLLKYLKQNKNSQIALDETLGEISFDELSDYKRAKAFILKPTILSYSKAMDYAHFAIENNIIPVISSSFESIFGILTLASMAAMINSNKFDIAVGLDTLDYFEENLLANSDIIDNGKIDISRHAFINQDINFDLLKEVELE